MSQEAAVPVATPSQPQPSVPPMPEPDRAPDDALLKLAQVDIPRDQARLKGGTPTIESINTELHATVLSYVREAVLALVAQRNWAYESLKAISDHLEGSDARIDLLEDVVISDGTAILPDDAQVLANVVVGCKHLAEQLLAGPFPIPQRDAEGQAKLHELIAMCDQAEGIIGESTLDEDDEGEGEEDEAEADEQPDDTASEQN